MQRLLLLLLAASVFGQEISNTHEVGTTLYDEHEALFALFPLDSATHVASTSGSWFSANTWEQGEIPTADSRVHIPSGLTVVYDSEAETRLFTILVEGTLEFSTSSSSKLVVDTLIGTPDSTITMGTKEDPVPEDVEIEILIANNGDIDVSWDPQLLSRGFITHGSFAAYGAEKTAFLKLAEDPLIGDTTLELTEAPSGWSVGDLLLLAGTHYEGWYWDNDIKRVRHYEPEDELVRITAISGTTVSIDTALIYNHESPRSDLKTYVANMDRNINIGTEGGASTPVNQRGHVMFMHNPSVDVRWMAFNELGRTDKSTEARDVGRFNTIRPNSNVKGRYSMHFHRTGVPFGSDQRNPAIAIGNVVFGSPGWGFVHHDSNAVFFKNVAYKCYGAGFSSESGNEVGAWVENMAVFSQGQGWGNPKNFVNLTEFDTGRSGDCFWFQSRMVKSIRNVAATCDSGFAYFHRGGIDEPLGNSGLSYNSMVGEFPQALGYGKKVRAPGHSPIRGFRDNEAFASNYGLFVVKSNPHQNHDVHSHLESLTAWSVRWGCHLEYTAHYILEDFDLVGRDPRDTRTLEGIHLGNNAGDFSILNPTITNFKVGIDFFGDHLDLPYLDRNFFILNPTYINVGVETGTGVTEHDHFITDADVTEEFEINLTTPLIFDGSIAGGAIVVIDGTKTDGFGTTSLPPPGDFGPDDYNASREEVIALLENFGYYTDASNPDVKLFILPDYYTDRRTAEVHKFGSIVPIEPDTADDLGNPFFSYANAVDMGEITLPNGAPTTEGESVSTTMDTDLTIDLISNDFDADGDEVFVDGIEQPRNGDVFTNGDGTVLYRPFYGYTGPDSFKYWVSDRHGNYVPAYVTIEVLVPGVDPGTNPIPSISSSNSASDGSNSVSDSPSDGGSVSDSPSDGGSVISMPEDSESESAASKVAASFLAIVAIFIAF